MKKIKNNLVLKIGAAVCTVFFLLLAPSSSWAATLVVPDTYTRIQDAIDAATSSDTVLVRAGSYTEDITMKNGVALVSYDMKNTEIKGRIIGTSNTKLEGFTITDSLSLNAKLYECAGCENVAIRDNAFVVNTTVSDYCGIYLSNVASGEIVNNSLNVASAGIKLRGIDISGSDVLCAQNNLYLIGADEVQAILYAGANHTILNNIITAHTQNLLSPEKAVAITGGDPLDINYNLLFGGVGENVTPLIGNLVGVDPVFVVGDPYLALQETSPALDAADPNYLYAIGITDIGTYDVSAIDKNVNEIQEEIDKAKPGDTVYIKPGVYKFISPVTVHILRPGGGTNKVFARDIIIDKNITLKAMDSNPDNTLVDLTGDHSHSISIFDKNLYFGSRYYAFAGFANVNDVTIEGITVTGACRDSEGVTVWARDEQTGYGAPSGHWVHTTNPNVKTPIYNFSEKLTLRNCKILSTNRAGYSIYSWLDTQLTVENTQVQGKTKRESDRSLVWSGRWRR